LPLPLRATLSRFEDFFDFPAFVDFAERFFDGGFAFDDFARFGADFASTEGGPTGSTPIARAKTSEATHSRFNMRFSGP